MAVGNGMCFYGFLVEKQLKSSSRKSLNYVRCNSQELLMKGLVVFGMICFPEKKFWQWALAYASMASQSKSSYFGPYLVVALQNQVFK